MDSLKDKVAIVTGAGQGIGFAIGERFAREGAHVVVAEIQPDKAQLVAEHFSSLGTEALAILMDVGEPAQIDMMVKTVVQKFWHIDILVNNAGVSEKAAFFEMTPERWDW
ncbi:MAG: SDR family NAD(P)-dependent oxidoreductase, partial [Chloroflexota bacterium]